MAVDGVSTDNVTRVTRVSATKPLNFGSTSRQIGDG